MALRTASILRCEWDGPSGARSASTHSQRLAHRPPQKRSSTSSVSTRETSMWLACRVPLRASQSGRERASLPHRGAEGCQAARVGASAAGFTAPDYRFAPRDGPRATSLVGRAQGAVMRCGRRTGLRAARTEGDVIGRCSGKAAFAMPPSL